MKSEWMGLPSSPKLRDGYARAKAPESSKYPLAPNSADCADVIWRPLGPAVHSGSGESGILVQNRSGRLALDVGRCLLTVDQEEARGWLTGQA